MNKPRKPTTSARDLLLEIGAEELPAAYLPAALEQLKSDAARLLQDAHVETGAIETFGTPRRLVLLAHVVSSVQRNPAEELRGPSKQVAFDASGTPTDALKGFLRSKGGELSHTKIVSTEKGDYVYLLKPARTVPTTTMLPHLLEQLIGRLRFPKTMRWDASGVRFARPVRWLVALYGAHTLRVKFGATTSGRSTWIGGPKHPKAVAVQSPTQYFTVLKRAAIQWNQSERRQIIERLVATHAKSHQGAPAPEMLTHGLLDEVTFLVEQPTPLYGQFQSKYLKLPREVLLASMAKHQRVFALEARLPAPRTQDAADSARQAGDGKLLPAFVAILDGKPRKLDEVRKVHEHILNARLADSLLFWEEDKRSSLEELNQRLEGVTFHGERSVRKKVFALMGMSKILVNSWKLTPQESEYLRKACEFSKTDLVTTMVKEFPTLQGVMGKHYAKAAEKPIQVAEAIAEQYLPLGDKKPTTRLGSALSILDKYDTLAYYFSQNIQPTGDQDPFGLRRAAQGIVETGWSQHLPIPLIQLFMEWQANTPSAHGKADTEKRVRDYILDRLYTFDWPKPVPSRDLIDAVLTSPCDDPVDAMDRIQQLQQLDGNHALLKAAKVIERTANILKGSKIQPNAKVEQERLQEPLEQQLWQRYNQHEDRIKQLITNKSYGDATKVYSEAFYDVLHEFFANVMVNVQDPLLQQNRLALMKIINTLYTDRIADLSKLTILQKEQV